MAPVLHAGSSSSAGPSGRRTEVAGSGPANGARRIAVAHSKCPAGRVSFGDMVAPVVRRILAPVELAETREPELDYAIGLAAQLRAELLLLAVVDTPATVNLIGRHRAMAGGDGDFEATLQAEVQEM